MISIWNDTGKIKFQSLEGRIKTDVLIIGGGMSGLLCAYMLKNAGVDCVLAEADELCKGITNSTTAKVTFQHGLIYDKIINKYGVEKAKMYYESQKSALEKIKSLANDNFEVCNSFVYSLDNKELIEKELLAFDKIGGKAGFCDSTELPFDIAGAVMVKDQGKFHPLKFAYSIAKTLNIYEHTKIIGIKKNIATTNKGEIKAEKIIVATHFPFINKHGGYFLKMYQHRSYVLALKNAPDIKDMYVDEAKNGLSLRAYNDLLLLGGGSHRTGKKGGCWAELEKFKEKYYPYTEEKGRWATQDCITLDSIPYIGRYSTGTDDLFVATGFNKWGMTSSMVSAMILSDMICGRKNKFEEVYSPHRSLLHPQLFINIIESFAGLAVPTAPRCPHLGCALKYNKEEHSWDCPCHGSRFDENGKLINNPSSDDMKNI